MRVKVVAWNMHQDASNWPRLRNWETISGAAAYLLCEARADPPKDIAQALHPQMYGSTKETKCECLPEGDRPMCRKRHYSTAIASPGGVESPIFGPETRVGTWIGGRVRLGAIPVTAFTLYGLGEVADDSPFDTYWESTKAAVDEVIAVLERGECGDHVLIGGDFNILAGRARVGEGDGDVLQSLKDLGYVECLEAGLSCEGHVDTRTEADLLACDCQPGVGCTHTRTFFSSGSPQTPHQDDYLFASEALAGLLKDCWAPSVGPASYSDHAPIVATFEVPK